MAPEQRSNGVESGTTLPSLILSLRSRTGEKEERLTRGRKSFSKRDPGTSDLSPLNFNNCGLRKTCTAEELFMGYCNDDLNWIYGAVFSMTAVDLLVCL